MSTHRLPMTVAQTRVYDCARLLSDRHGYPPTRAEIADHLGMASPNAVDQHLRSIAAKGWIALPRGKTRNIVFCSSVEDKPHTERDGMRAEIERLRDLIRECAEYLSHNELTSIGHGSILHRKMIDAAMEPIK